MNANDKLLHINTTNKKFIMQLLEYFIHKFLFSGFEYLRIS